MYLESEKIVWNCFWKFRNDLKRSTIDLSNFWRNWPLIHGNEGQIEPVLALEHALFVRQFEQRRRTERRTNGEQGQRRLFGLPVLAVQHFDASSDVQSLSNEKPEKIRKLFQMNDGMKRYARECHPRRGLRAGDTFGGRWNNKRRNRRQRKKKSVQFFIRPQGKTNRKNEEDAEAPGGSRVNYRAPWNTPSYFGCCIFLFPSIWFGRFNSA